MGGRLTILIVALFAGFAFLVFHLADLQLAKGSYYNAKAESELSASESNNANRGTIYFTDKDGIESAVALDQQFPIIYAVPTAIKNPEQTSQVFAPIVSMSASSLEQIFSRPNDSYELLINKADPAVAQKVTDLNIPGVYADFEPERYYPLSTVASQVLGYVGPNAANNGESGHYGVEGLYNNLLEGTSSDGTGGSDLQLTIDPNIQIEAEKVLHDLVTTNNATGGSVIVEDPQTGAILAMGGDPDFDP